MRKRTMSVHASNICIFGPRRQEYTKEWTGLSSSQRRRGSKVEKLLKALHTVEWGDEKIKNPATKSKNHHPRKDEKELTPRNAKGGLVLREKNERTKLVAKTTTTT